jgi:hypothetical protein
MIALLGGSVIEDEPVRRALLASIDLLKQHQTAAGLIPNNVDVESGRPNFRAYADGGLWFVIGSSILAPDLDAIGRALDWHACHDVDQSGLLSMQESADWQDLFCTRGKGLYLNCLYVLALRRAAALGGPSAAQWTERADRAVAGINRWLWYRGDGDLFRHVMHSFSTENIKTDSLGRERWIPRKRALIEDTYYLPYLAFRDAGEWFDTFGNLLAILAGVAGKERTRAILKLIEAHGDPEHPVRSLFPAVRPGDRDWRDYYGELNQPDCYHNGGIWPFLGGFYVAALVAAGKHEKASAALERLAALNRAGEFNEWHDGRSAEPAGVRDQAWSAGMYLYADECVRLGRPALQLHPGT